MYSSAAFQRESPLFSGLLFGGSIMHHLLFTSTLLALSVAFGAAPAHLNASPRENDSSRSTPQSDEPTEGGNVEELMEKAKEFRQQKNWEEMKQCLSRAVEIDPTLVKAWTQLAFACNQLKDYQEALDAAQSALDLEANNKSALIQCGRAELELQDYLAARLHLLKAVEIDPNSSTSWKYLGKVYGKLAQEFKGESEVADAFKKLAQDAQRRAKGQGSGESPPVGE
jgi:tetratricopeptide (TPR) repeat protein